MARTYLRLPIDADEGFPQSFRLDIGGASYRLLLYVNLLEEDGGEADEDEVLDLPLHQGGREGQRDAFLVLRVSRESEAGAQVVFQRKLVCGVEYEFADVAMTFREMRIARRNLNGIGPFGSRVVGGVARRWAS